MTGAMSSPTGTPASDSSDIARKRAAGSGAEGSSAFAVSSSAKGMEKKTLAPASRASAASKSLSRRTSADFVTTPTGFRNSRQTSRHALVNL